MASQSFSCHHARSTFHPTLLYFEAGLLFLAAESTLIRLFRALVVSSRPNVAASLTCFPSSDHANFGTCQWHLWFLTNNADYNRYTYTKMGNSLVRQLTLQEAQGAPCAGHVGIAETIAVYMGFLTIWLQAFHRHRWMHAAYCSDTLGWLSGSMQLAYLVVRWYDLWRE